MALSTTNLSLNLFAENPTIDYYTNWLNTMIKLGDKLNIFYEVKLNLHLLTIVYMMISKSHFALCWYDITFSNRLTLNLFVYYYTVDLQDNFFNKTLYCLHINKCA